MTMSDERKDGRWDRVGEEYHVPPQTPKTEMWEAIASRIDAASHPSAQVTDLEQYRDAREVQRSRGLGWAVAAAAVLVIGIGIGRMTAPPGAVGPAVVAEASGSALVLAAQRTLGRSETLLTMVKADAQEGRVDPAVASWTLGLLSETRLLLDAGVVDDDVRELLEDMELVLVQLVGVMAPGEGSDARRESEVQLALQGMNERQVLPRIQAMLPQNSVLYGT